MESEDMKVPTISSDKDENQGEKDNEKLKENSDPCIFINERQLLKQGFLYTNEGEKTEKAGSR